VGLWLSGVAALIFTIILVGGATRLTDSGLSITEWAPIHGVIPPLTHAQWLAEFERYRQIPEYQIQNAGMTLAQFQFIFWWEWGHRLLGRVIGLAVLVPLVIFAATRQLRPGMGWPLAGIVLLVGLQGAIGWWMVHSGLSGERLDVAAYRLATHLSMAFILFALTSWIALDHLAPRAAGRGDAVLLPWSVALVVLVASQVVLGAFVAGTDAGFAHNDFPTIDGHWLPQDYGRLEPLWRNWTENTQAIQFNHRIGAYAVAVLAVLVWAKARSSQDAGVRRLAATVAVLVAAQVVLGIGTLHMFRYHAPPELAGLLTGIAHQGLGALVFAASVLLVRAAAPVQARQGTPAGSAASAHAGR
jgi:cytochrome c oxidase assembly protein subunit 15